MCFTCHLPELLHNINEAVVLLSLSLSLSLFSCRFRCSLIDAPKYNINCIIVKAGALRSPPVFSFQTLGCRKAVDICLSVGHAFIKNRENQQEFVHLSVRLSHTRLSKTYQKRRPSIIMTSIMSQIIRTHRLPYGSSFSSPFFINFFVFFSLLPFPSFYLP